MKLNINEMRKFEISENFDGLSMKTTEDRIVNIFQRDWGFEILTDGGQWYSIQPENTNGKNWNMTTRGTDKTDE